MVQVDQYPALGVRPVKGVVSVCATRLTLFFLVGGLTAEVDSVVLARAQIYHICVENDIASLSNAFVVFVQKIHFDVRLTSVYKRHNILF